MVLTGGCCSVPAASSSSYQEGGDRLTSHHNRLQGAVQMVPPYTCSTLAGLSQIRSLPWSLRSAMFISPGAAASHSRTSLLVYPFC